MEKISEEANNLINWLVEDLLYFDDKNPSKKPLKSRIELEAYVIKLETALRDFTKVYWKHAK